MAITTRTGKGSQLTWAEMDANLTELDRRTQVSWQNLNGTIQTAGLASPPNKYNFLGEFPIDCFDPDNVQTLIVKFNIPHDYVAGSPIYPHGHMTVHTPSVGTVRWRFALAYAAEFDISVDTPPPAAGNYFGLLPTQYVPMPIIASYEGAHLLLEGAPAEGITLPGLAPDSVVLMTVSRDATHIDDTYPDGICLMAVDLYYQSQRFGSDSR
jgi:hypothetical protein